MSERTLFSLDEPRPIGPVGRVAWVVGIIGYAIITLLVARAGDTMLEPIPWVPITHAIVTALVCAFTSVLLFGQAATTGRRAYRYLGCTYLFVATLLGSFPLFFPGALRPDSPLLGGSQSSITIFYLWHLGFLIGVIATMVVLARDQRTHRRPSPRRPSWPAVIGVLGLALSLIAVVAVGQAGSPAFLQRNGQVTVLASTMDWLTLALAVVATGIGAVIFWHGAQINRWLFALALLLLGESIINVRSTGRWSLAWYYDRLFGVIALTSLFAALVVLLARVGRATNRLAMNDSLTGSQSRAAFALSMQRELAAARRDGSERALLWVDLDGFKSVNDQVGHVVGDDVLRQVSERLRAAVRTTDQVGRLGGDEFGVLLCDQVSDDRIWLVADRLLRALRDPVVVDHSTTLLSASIGIAVSPRDAVEADDLLTRADLAMYAAKFSGGDRCRVFSTDLADDAAGRADLRHNLTVAIRNHEFDLDVQPLVALDGAAGSWHDGETAGLEVLVRWQTPSGRLAAADFVDFATQSGQIIQIGRQVVQLLERHAGQLLRTLPTAGFLTMNLSVKELTDPALVDRLLGGPLAKHAGQVLIEVTESAELQAGTDAERHLDQLRLRGYKVAIDDFGAGFSNFSRLEQLQPYLLKVDRTLIWRAADRELTGGTAFLAAAVSVASSLQSQVVAEGIETVEQLRIARDLGIALGQGYLLGRPTPIGAWLTRPAGRSTDSGGRDGAALHALGHRGVGDDRP